MGNITGKGEGDDPSSNDLGGDIGSVAPHSMGLNAPGTASSGASTSLAVTKKKMDHSSDPHQPHSSSAAAGVSDEDPNAILERLFGDRGVPMVFRWELGGDEVFITGTFNNWSAKIPMARSGNDFVHIHELSRGKHAYKFIVDDEWRFTSDQHTMADKSGNINNFLDLTDFKPKFENLPDLSASLANKYLDESLYGNRIPDINEYTKEPPLLPQHLRSIVLNYKSGVPQHVTLDHLYCTARKDGLMVLGMSQRYLQKYVTTIYYSPVNGGFPGLVPGSKRSTTTTSVSTPSSAVGILPTPPTSSSKSVPPPADKKRGFGQ